MKSKKLLAFIATVSVCATFTACNSTNTKKPIKEHTYAITSTFQTYENIPAEITTTTTTTTADTTMSTTAESDISETQENTFVETTVAEKENPAAETLTGIRPEFKEALDSYEAFFDKYCDIMKKYMENPLDMSILTEYYEYVEKAEEMDEKLEALDDEEMSDEELEYYLEVTARVTTKMLEIYQ